MARVLYLDCFSGISGDKTLGAFVDLGLPIEELRRELGKLPLQGYRVEAKAVARNWMRGTQVEVHVEGEHGHRGGKEIDAIIGGSTLPDTVKERATAMFTRILEEEARVHGITVDEVHLHEVGAVDAIVDIVGTAIAVESFKPDRIVASPVNVGSGTVKTQHGLLPVPAPATAEILRGVPVCAEGPAMEMTTPTGATIVKTLAADFGPVPAMTVERIGYGAGSRDPEGFPNLLRLLWGTADGPGAHGCGEIEIETNVDDSSPQVLAHAMERLYAAGCLEVFFQPVQMKKSRPGVLVTAILPAHRLREASDVIFRETSSIGLRYREVRRVTLDRRFEKIQTTWGPITMKISSRGGDVTQVTPEYEEARLVAAQAGVPLPRVLEEALAAWRRGGGA